MLNFLSLSHTYTRVSRFPYLFTDTSDHTLLFRSVFFFFPFPSHSSSPFSFLLSPFLSFFPSLPSFSFSLFSYDYYLIISSNFLSTNHVIQNHAHIIFDYVFDMFYFFRCHLFCRFHLKNATSVKNKRT